MTNQSVAKRYARALFAIGEEQDKLASFDESLRGLAALATTNEEVKELLASHFISISRKKEVMGAILADDDPLIRNFVYLLLDKNRAMNLVDVCEAFEILMEERENILHASVKSAVPLDGEQVTQIERKFSALTKQTVKAKVTVDQSLIGGVLVRVGDKVYDGTIAHQLVKMGQTLKEAKM